MYTVRIKCIYISDDLIGYDVVFACLDMHRTNSSSVHWMWIREKKLYILKKNQDECAVCLEATCEEQTTSQLNKTESSN
jgi:hypothetical protein